MNPSQTVLALGRIYYATSSRRLETHGSSSKDIEIIDNYFSEDNSKGHNAICVIENVSPDVEAWLGKNWNVEPDFLKAHAFNPTIDELEARPNWHGSISNPNPVSSNFRSEHIHGIVDMRQDAVASHGNHHPRLTWRSNINSLLRGYNSHVSSLKRQSYVVSYCRVKPNLYLFLVDAPIEISKVVTNEHNASTGLLATTRFPYSGSRFGVLAPSTRFYPMSPYIALRAMFFHVWHIEMLFKHPDVFPSVPFLYLMITSLSESSLRTLDHDIKRAGFTKVRNPTPSLTNELHDLRERLEQFESLVNMNNIYMRPNVIEFFTDLRSTYHFTMSPKETHEDLLLRSQKLSAFLMETFQLLMNMLSIMDSQKNLEQSSQSVLLGSLAAIYLPIGAATGIFGMNLKELNDSGQHIWWFVVTLIGLGLVSAAVWWLATKRRRWHTRTGIGPGRGIGWHLGLWRDWLVYTDRR